MRIQELEHQVGIERATIRFYEKEGLIAPKRSENGYRDYSEEDTAELRRIKLLRELGVSLETIRSLQQGSADFREVMEKQAMILRGRQQQMDRARAVCERISADGATYVELDTGHYQSLLEAPQLPTPVQQRTDSTPYSEKVDREVHPWRRFFAHFLDHEIMAVGLWFIVVVLLRWRPAVDMMATLVSYAAWYLMVPAEAVMLHFFGTTPGKWLMGIRVEYTAGGKLDFSTALERSWRVLFTGTGLQIPILRLYCMYKGYRAHTREYETDWDYECESEIVFRNYSWRNVVLALAVYALVLGLDLISGNDAVLPKYRSNDLTLSQFAANYNMYNQLLYDGSKEPMESDGTLQEINHTIYMDLPDFGTLVHNPYAQFEYEMTGDVVDSVTFHHTWYEQNVGAALSTIIGGHIDAMDYWLPGHCKLAMDTAIASQAGLDPGTMREYMDRLESDLVQPATGSFTGTYGAVTCTWDLDLDLYVDYDEDSTYPDVYEVTLDMRIEFE